MRIIALCGILFISSFYSLSANFTSFVNARSKEVGLKNDQGDICFSMTIGINIINLNLNSTNNKIPFDLPFTSLSGKCSKGTGGDTLLTATIFHKNRKRQLKFYIGSKNILIKQVRELRWQVRRVVYIESYGDTSVLFESGNSSIVISAPLNQKFVCKDKLNVTLQNQEYKNVILEFLPEIEIVPYGAKSNFYLCERTRRRTLTESFENKATIFSGFILGLSSLGTIIGHSVRRHFLPIRKEMYQNLGI